MRGRSLYAQLIDRHFRPGECLIEFLVRRIDAQMLGGKFLKVLLRAAVEGLKSAVEGLAAGRPTQNG